MLKNLFNEKKAAQAAAYFLFRAGGPLSVLKLMKLLYFAERRSFEKFGEPMIGDRLASMPHGPVLSCTYNHMNGDLPSIEGGWEFWIADRAEHDLALRDPGALQPLDRVATQAGHVGLGEQAGRVQPLGVEQRPLAVVGEKLCVLATQERPDLRSESGPFGASGPEGHTVARRRARAAASSVSSAAIVT